MGINQRLESEVVACMHQNREKEHNKMSSEEEEKRDKLICEFIVDRYNLEWKRTNDLDSKASSVTGMHAWLSYRRKHSI